MFLGHKPDGTNNISIDHRFGNSLNNRVDNLRLITNRQNTVEGKRTEGGTSQYVGVYWRKARNRFYCTIQLEGIGVHLGTSTNEEELSKYYKKALTKYNSNEPYYKKHIHRLTLKEKEFIFYPEPLGYF